MVTDMTGFCGLHGRALRSFRTYYIIGQTRTTDRTRPALTWGQQSRARAALDELSKVPGLAGSCEDALPQPTVCAHLFPRGDGQRDRHVSESTMPEADHHVGLTGHSGIHCGIPKQLAEGRVAGVRGQAADDVARVDVLQADLEAVGPAPSRDLL